MKWPWSKPVRDRASITFLEDGVIVIGWPRGSNQPDCEAVMDALSDWRADGRPPALLLFPWPVDVTDLRK